MDISKKLSFKNKRTVTLDNKIVVPIPEGLQYSVDPLVIGNQRKLVAVPVDYPISGDFMDAPIGFSVQYLDLKQKFELSRPIEVYKMWLLRIGTLFDAGAKIFEIDPKEGDVTFYQMNQSPNGDVTVSGLKWVGERAYYLHVHFIGFEITNAEFLLSKGVDWFNKISTIGEKKDVFPMAIALEKNYPHYNSMFKTAGNSLPGLTVVTNANGTEYEFIPFSVAAKNDETSETLRNVYNRIIDKDTGKYCLIEAAKEMQPIFHVNKSAFDPKHDRECEIEQGLLHRAYMMSALRSFAWTIAAYCEEKEISAKDIKTDILEKLVDFIAEKDWLNYCGNSYCKGLCSGSDLHVYFIPDKVSQADRKKLLPSAKELEDDRKIKETFSNYNPIHSEVHSLDELRKDLEYVYPVVHKLWKKLLKNRNYNKALTGNEADIVYAWCSLAYAAREPFFSEDGPMRCCFKQLDSTVPEKTTATRKKSNLNNDVLLVATSKDKKTSYKKYSFPEYEVKSSRKKFLKKSPALRQPVHLHGCDIKLTKLYDKDFSKEKLELIELIESVYLTEEKKTLKQNLFNKALEIAKLFDVSESEFDAENDKAAMIKSGYIKTIYQLHALRSFAWTLTKWAKENKKEIKDITIDELIALADFIEQAEGANYNASAVSDTTFCASLRPKQEFGKIYAGISGKIEIPGIERSESGPTSIYALRNDLYMLAPAIDVILEYCLMEKQKNECISSTISDILFAWAVFAFASREPFYVEQGPETVSLVKDAILSEEKNVDLIASDTNGFYIRNGFLLAIEKKKCNVDNLVIPDGVEKILFGGLKLSCIVYDEHPDFCFLQDVQRLMIPGTMKYSGSFAECKMLKEITFESGVEKITGGAFWCNKNIEKINLPETIKEISQSAFYCCKKLKSITVPKSVELIGEKAFDSCDELEEVNILSSVTISKQVFCRCKNLKSIIFWGNVEEIGEEAFYGCNNLEKVVFKSNLKKIGKKAFCSCNNIKRITIPASVIDIGEGAFDWVYGLEGPNSWHYNFGKDKYDFVFEVYKDSYAEKYAKSKGWYHNVILTEEQIARQEAARRAEQERIAEAKRLEELRKLREEEERKIQEAKERAKKVKRYNTLLEEKDELLKAIAENKGLFGEKARKRKEAKKRLGEVLLEIEEYKDLV